MTTDETFDKLIKAKRDNPNNPTDLDGETIVMNHIRNDLRGELFSAIEPAIYNHDDKHYLDQALDRLQAIIARECDRARIDELEHIGFNSAGAIVRVGKAPELTPIYERLAQLKAEAAQKGEDRE